MKILLNKVSFNFKSKVFYKRISISALNALKRTHQSLLKKQKLGENTDNKDDNLENTILDHIWYKRTYKQFFTRKELYRPFFFITFLTIIQQFSGMTVIRSYVVKIFNEIGKQSYFPKSMTLDEF